MSRGLNTVYQEATGHDLMVLSVIDLLLDDRIHYFGCVALELE
jgi:hypothetical protein